MENKKNVLKGQDQLVDALFDRILTIPEKMDRCMFVTSLIDCTSLLHEVQCQEHRLRLEIWAATFDLIYFLRQNGQLGRNQLDFDEDVKKFLSGLYGTMIDEFIINKKD